MKKWMSIAFLTLAILMLAMPVYAETDAEAAEEITAAYPTVVYGAKTVTCENEIIEEGDFTFLPLRETLEVYGASLSWAEGEAETKVIITAGQDRCQLVLDLEKELAYGLDGKEFLLRFENGTLYLPVHFFVQFVNCEYGWDKEQHILTFYPEQMKAEAVKTLTDGTAAVSRWIMNLPAYEQTVASRSGGQIYETGKASYYGGKFHGRRTASGERYDKNAFTAAHKTLPFGTIVRVTAEWNQKSVEVRITDRGPYKHGRVIDLSTAAAAELGMLSKGVGNVSLEIVSMPK